MMDKNNQLVRCTVGTDGKLSLGKQILYVPSIDLGSIPTKVLEAGKEFKDRVHEARMETQSRYGGERNRLEMICCCLSGLKRNGGWQ
jgi:hypothetical protein